MTCFVSAGRHLPFILAAPVCLSAAVDAASAEPKVIFPFDLVGGNGPNGLTQGSDGRLRGTTAAGGANNSGTCFAMSTKGKGHVYGSFRNEKSGSNPNGSLVEMPDGYFYGTANTGGKKLMGTVFRCAPSGRTAQAVATFTGTNGRWPVGGLLKHSSGDLYGVTSSGGALDKGVVFRYRVGGRLQTVANLADLGLSKQWPSSLVEGKEGVIYGTLRGDGGEGGHGTVFRVSPAGQISVSATFDPELHGSGPIGLTPAIDGSHYGSANGGGAIPWGSVFR